MIVQRLKHRSGCNPAACLIIAVIAIFFLAGCGAPRIKLFSDATDPLREFTIQGKGEEKVVVIDINGIISDDPKRGIFFQNAPSMVEEVVSQLEIAQKDNEVKAVVLKVNSPGGTTTASDILYKEIGDFKKETGAKVVVTMMDVAASGGYYISLPADYIMAHPTTVTGSVGVIFMRPEAYGLMEKIGVGVTVNKSGRNKDMGSPFRESTEEEEELFNALIGNLSTRFLGLVKKHRNTEGAAFEDIKTARIYVAEDALKAGLIDQIGYVEDALDQAKKMANLDKDAKVVVYRRTEYPNDTLYNTSSSHMQGNGMALVNIEFLNSLPSFKTGFYYLWWPQAGSN